MRVSAIPGIQSYNTRNVYRLASKSINVSRSVQKNEKPDAEIQFNSLPVSNRKSLPQIYKDINEWKNFCHKQISNGKLDIIA